MLTFIYHTMHCLGSNSDRKRVGWLLATFLYRQGNKGVGEPQAENVTSRVGSWLKCFFLINWPLRVMPREAKTHLNSHSANKVSKTLKSDISMLV